MSNTEEEISETTIEDILMEKKLILFNDTNTFETVITALIVVMKYTSEQSEQLALIVHNKGKATIKSGTFMELERYYNDLKEFGLTLKIE